MLDQLSYLASGFDTALSLYHIGLMAAGVLLGILVGVLPGLGAPNGVTLLLPLTFTMEPVAAIILLSSMYWGALFGGSTTSILFNIPGEPSSVATTFDGHPMARKGFAPEALATAFIAAGFGAMTGVVVVTLIANAIADFALKFGPPEFFAVYLLTFCSYLVSGGSPLKTLASLLIGLILATVGMDTVSGEMRLTYGSNTLVSGISFLAAVVGLFGIGELLVTIEEGLKFNGLRARMSWGVVWQAIKKMPKHGVTLIRSTIVGCWMGITPGGPTAASFMSYGLAKRFSKYRNNFGKGEPDGVVAPEAADHSAGVSALLPMLALGVPGSATAAVMMGGLMIWGLQPGPMLFIEQPDFVWGLISSMYVANIVAVVLVLATIPLFSSILRAPFAVIGPLIIVICLIGAYTISGKMSDVYIALVFGVVGYVFKKLDYPIAPLILAMVLGDKTEDAFRQSMLLADGSLGVFFENGLVGTIMTAALLLLVWGLVGRLFTGRSKQPIAEQ
ncbi:tripartite tricarboxylate transporter permease [Bordetella genomosp. 4]|uniref:Tricarboxylate transporter n=1 Tax=Bordetella genomosp. 4 TaxID=463044 RepID=A0A261TY69_9BORD|nr:tripartite tricarboxylate transporter permease [Bordetella genomosp. 4]OZI54658.1 tricarboxylate transporter [Bordetella genomosp. 4]